MSCTGHGIDLSNHQGVPQGKGERRDRDTGGHSAGIHKGRDQGIRRRSLQEGTGKRQLKVKKSIFGLKSQLLMMSPTFLFQQEKSRMSGSSLVPTHKTGRSHSANIIVVESPRQEEEGTTEESQASREWFARIGTSSKEQGSKEKNPPGT